VRVLDVLKIENGFEFEEFLTDPERDALGF